MDSSGSHMLQVSYDMALAPGGLPGLWSAERPRLYWLRLCLLDSCGRLLEAESCQCGFRTVEVSGGQLLLNKRPIMVKGCNRHEHDERAGKAVSEVSGRQAGHSSSFMLKYQWISTACKSRRK